MIVTTRPAQEVGQSRPWPTQLLSVLRFIHSNRTVSYSYRAVSYFFKSSDLGFNQKITRFNFRSLRLIFQKFSLGACPQIPKKHTLYEH